MRRRETPKTESKLKQMNLTVLQKYCNFTHREDRKEGQTEGQILEKDRSE